MRGILTQRESKDEYGVSIDVLESTYVVFFEKMGLDITAISNFHIVKKRIIERNKCSLIILTGGGAVQAKYYDKPCDVNVQENRDKTELCLIQKAIELKIPILAICRGMQYVNGMFGGKISKLNGLNVDREIGKCHEVYLGGRVIRVNNYHNDGVYLKNLASGFEVVAFDVENNVVEGFYSREKKILGLQWHPERTFEDVFSQEESTKLVKEFIKNGGVINESYYISSGTRDKT